MELRILQYFLAVAEAENITAAARKLHMTQPAVSLAISELESYYGVKLFEDGPRILPNGKYEYNYLPVFTSLCDLCAERVEMGKLPTCVHHCQAACMKYGKVEDLAKMAAETPRSWVYVPEQ